MEQNVVLSSSRWLGRLYGVLVLVLSKKGIDSNKLANMSVAELYLEVQNVASDKDKVLIDKLMSKFNDVKAKETLNQDANVTKEQQRLGVMEAKYVSNTYDNLSMLLQEQYFLQEKQKISKKKILYGMMPILVVILGICIYYLPFFEEIRSYNKVMEDRDIVACLRYEDEHPNGRHLDDVMYLKVELTGWMNYMTEYLIAFPMGKYLKVVNAKCDSIWDMEILKYQERDKVGHAPAAVSYMQEMLQYMKTKRVNVINIDIKSHINVKDYTEYDESLRKLIELFSDTKKLPIAGNMMPLKDNFTSEDQKALADILVTGLQKSMDRIFTPEFIKVKYENNDTYSPSACFNYEVQNQEDKSESMSVPNIWTYTQNDIPKAYLLGISIAFKADFSIPNSSTRFSYKENGNPGTNIDNIDGIKDGYRQMTKICFGQFSNTMADKLGLEKIYFNGDDNKKE